MAPILVDVGSCFMFETEAVPVRCNDSVHKIFRALEMFCLMQIANIALVGRHFSDFSWPPRECSSRTPMNEYSKHFRRDDDEPLSKEGVIRSTVSSLFADESRGISVG